MQVKKINLLLTLSFLSTLLVFLIYLPGRAAPKASGSLETGGYFYQSEESNLSETKRYYRAYENINLDVDFTDKARFHTNGRVMYRSNPNESPEQWEYNLFYGYIDADLAKGFNVQAGRIMDVKNLLFASYDGANFQYSAKASKLAVTLNAYGGLVVSDRYLDEDNKANPYKDTTAGYKAYPPKYINSFDVRNIAANDRKGDSIGGGKLGILADGIGILSADFQAIFNNSRISEEYASVDFETFFSKMMQLYGWGIFDLVENYPSSTLAGARLNPFNFLSIVAEHEYYRPVFMKDSFWQIYFGRYSTQEARARLIFIISQKMTADLKYGKLYYDAVKRYGNDIWAGLEHRDILNFRLKISGDYMNGPEGDLLNLRSTLSRRVYIFDILAGGGAAFYDYDKNYFSNFARGYFAVLGIDANILKSLIISANGEYYRDPVYKYNVKGLLSAKYLF